MKLASVGAVTSVLLMHAKISGGAIAVNVHNFDLRARRHCNWGSICIGAGSVRWGCNKGDNKGLHDAFFTIISGTIQRAAGKLHILRGKTQVK